MQWSNVLAYSVAAAIIVLIPGPSVLFAIGRALTLGRATAWWAVVGNTAGVFGQVIAVAAGLAAVVAASAAAFTVIKLVGAGYLVYLGVQAWRHRREGTTFDVAGAGPAVMVAPGYRRAFLDGAVVGVTNPKTIVFLAALLPQFLTAGGWPVPVQLLVLGLIFNAIGIVFDSMYVLAAGTARDWFATSPARLAGLRGAGGVAMVGLGVVTASIPHS